MQDHQAAGLCRAIAEEIRQVSHLVEELAQIIVSDEEVAIKHIHRLQAFDLVVQRAGESARLLDKLAEGVHSQHAIEGIGLESLQQRLRDAADAD